MEKTRGASLGNGACGRMMSADLELGYVFKILRMEAALDVFYGGQSARGIIMGLDEVCLPRRAHRLEPGWWHFQMVHQRRVDFDINPRGANLIDSNVDGRN